MSELLDNLSSEEILALTLYGEGRGELVQGQIAIGCVIRNRVIKSQKNYKEICLAPKQFSCWNEDDPNRTVLEEMASKIVNGEVSDIHFRQCLFVSKGIIDRFLIDNVNGAINYMTNDLFYSDNKPKWALRATNVRNIGSHMFFNA